MDESRPQSEQPEIGKIMPFKELPSQVVYKKVESTLGVEQFRFKDNDGKAYPAIKKDINFVPQFKTGIGEVIIKNQEELIEVVGYIKLN